MKFKSTSECTDILQEEKEEENKAQKGEETRSNKKKKKKQTETKAGRNPTAEEKKDMMTVITSEKATSMDVNEMLKVFNSDIKTGLSDSEAKRRKRLYGANEFDVGGDEPLWKKYICQVIVGTQCCIIEFLLLC